MRLHQTPVAALTKRLELDHLLRVSDRLAVLARPERRVVQAFERAHEELAEVAPPLLDPVSVLAGQEAASSERGRRRALRARLGEVARGECRFRSIDRFRRRVDVDPRACGQRELVAAESARQRARAVDAALLEHRAELRHQHPERLLPGRRELLAPEQLCELVTRNGPPVLRRQVGEDDPALPAGKALLVQACTVRLDGETLRQGDPNVQAPSFRAASGALATV